MEITLVDIPERQAAAVLHVGPFDGIGAAFARVGAWAQANSGLVTGEPLALYLDDPQRTAPDELRSYAAVPISSDAALDSSGEVEAIALAGGRYAVATHRGSYAGLAAAWQEFMAAVPADGQRPDWSRPCFEVYANMPGMVPDEDLVTELYQPIA